MSISMRNRLLSAAAAFVLLLLALAFQASRADANTPILHYSTLPSTSQAGGHPDVAISFKVANRLVQESQSLCNCEDARDATVHFPPGLIGNPSATPKCTIADFSADDCPIDSQVGITFVTTGPGIPIQFLSAVYNLVPPPGVAGLTGFKLSFFDSAQFTVLSSRTDSDYGLDATATSIFHGSGTPLWIFKQLLWGVPADPSHNALRINLNEGNVFAGGSTLFGEEFCDAEGAPSGDDPRTMVKACGGGNPAPSNSPLTPFLQNPTSCEEPLETTFDVLSYDGETTHTAASWPQATGCNQLSFNPSLYAQPTTRQTDSASGIDVNLSVPQQLSPTVPSPSELKAATVTLPAGFSINSNAVDGKTSCSDAEANFGTRIAAECPEFAKVGSLELLSSALPGPLPGFVYLGSPLPGNRYRLFLVADGFATHVKLAGTVTPDPETGRLTISFPSLPQTPLTAFNMHFFGSERGALATPTKCGKYAVQSTFVPWDSRLEPQTSSQFFTLDSGPGGAPCPQGARKFEPTFKAASTGNTAGARSPIRPRSSRERRRSEPDRADGDRAAWFDRLASRRSRTARSPRSRSSRDSSYPGLSELAASSCPAASLIGTATAGAGAGSRPLHVPGKVYLAGPYKGSPVSIVVVVPAVSGPYDLGNVAVRAAIHIDPETAQVTATSDPLPQILEGVPLRLRSIQVNLDRPDFAINPTNCDSFAVSGTLFGNEGGRVTRTDPYQVGNCAQPAVQAEPDDESKRRIEATGPSGDPRSTQLERRRSEQQACVRHPSPRAATRQQPHRHRLHESRFRREKVSGRLAGRQGGSDHTPSRPPTLRARSTFAPRAMSCPIWHST